MKMNEDELSDLLAAYRKHPRVAKFERDLVNRIRRKYKVDTTSLDEIIRLLSQSLLTALKDSSMKRNKTSPDYGLVSEWMSDSRTYLQDSRTAYRSGNYRMAIAHLCQSLERLSKALIIVSSHDITNKELSDLNHNPCLCFFYLLYIWKPYLSIGGDSTLLSKLTGKKLIEIPEPKKMKREFEKNANEVIALTKNEAFVRDIVGLTERTYTILYTVEKAAIWSYNRNLKGHPELADSVMGLTLIKYHKSIPLILYLSLMIYPHYKARYPGFERIERNHPLVRRLPLFFKRIDEVLNAMV
jgi:hypothetical protein